MPECLYPTELGGRAYFEEVPQELPDWMPTADHFPVLKEEGGQRTVGNVRLAHRLCNRIDYSKRIGRPYAKDPARVEAARARAVTEMSGHQASQCWYGTWGWGHLPLETSVGTGTGFPNSWRRTRSMWRCSTR